MRQPARAITLLLSFALIATMATGCGSYTPGRQSHPAAGSDPQTQSADRSGGPEFRAALRACHSVAPCYLDTARVQVLDHEPVRSVASRWVIFGTAGDSIELSASTDLRLDALGSSERVGFAISARHAMTSGYQERDSTGNTAPYVRFRLPTDGAVSVDVGADERGLYDTVPYNVSLRRIGQGFQPRRFQATGHAAALTLASTRELDRFVIAPLSVADWAMNPARWAVLQGRFKVALVADSLYVVCKLPCGSPDTVLLKPSMAVTRQY